MLPQMRAAYSANIKEFDFYKDMTKNESGEDEYQAGTLYSMYSDVWDIAEQLGLVQKGMKGYLKLLGTNPTSVAEYSGMAGLGYIDNGGSRMRASTRMKENLRSRLDKLKIESGSSASLKQAVKNGHLPPFTHS